jgi:hypothetical protein
MTTKTTPPNNDSVSNFINSILKKSTTATSEISPEEFAVLVTSVKIIAQELQSVTRSVELIISAVEQQNKAINELYTVQEFVLKQLKTEVEDKLESSLSPATPKAKKEKPN